MHKNSASIASAAGWQQVGRKEGCSVLSAHSHPLTNSAGERRSTYAGVSTISEQGNPIEGAID